MSGMFGGGKKGGPDHGILENQQKFSQMATDAVTDGFYRGINQYNKAIGSLDQGGKLGKVYSSVLDDYAGYDDAIKSAIGRVKDNYYQPIQDDVKKELANYTTKIGPSGLRNSRGQYALAKYGQNLSDSAGRRLNQMEDDAISKVIQKFAGKANPIIGLQSSKAGLEKGSGDFQGNMTQAIANTKLAMLNPMSSYNQMKTTADMQRQSAGNNMLTTGISALASAFL